jgi:hypothetical protein
MHLPTKYASRMTSVAEMMMALRAAHFQLQYLEGFLRFKAGREKVLRGRGRGGGEWGGGGGGSTQCWTSAGTLGTWCRRVGRCLRA